MNLALRAIARTSEIIVQDMGSEALIYDLKVNRALSLNETAARVWKSLDGRATVAEIARSTELPPEIVLLTLEQLQKQNLLHSEVETGLAKDRLSRRQMLTKLAASSFALPIIVGIIAPTATLAQSGCINPGGQSPGSTFEPGVLAECSEGLCPAACMVAGFNCCSNVADSTGICMDVVGAPPFSTCECICVA